MKRRPKDGSNLICIFLGYLYAPGVAYLIMLQGFDPFAISCAQGGLF